METMLLRDKDIFPTNEVLENVLGKCYAAYKELTDVMTNEYDGLTLEWRFYNDGKS